MKYDAGKAAGRGAEKLDKIDPFWYTEIDDIEGLRMEWTDSCVLGQWVRNLGPTLSQFGSYRRALPFVFRTGMNTSEQTIERYGFMAPLGEGLGIDRYRDLTEAWKDEILARWLDA